MKYSDSFPHVFDDKLIGESEANREVINRELSGARSDELAMNPIKGNYDIEHMAKIHEHLFQDVSSHAGFRLLKKDKNIYIKKKELKAPEGAPNPSLTTHVQLFVA